MKQISVMAYPGNLGFMEMAQFFQVATPEQKTEMEEITKREDWEGFVKLIRGTLGMQLVPRSVSSEDVLQDIKMAIEQSNTKDDIPLLVDSIEGEISPGKITRKKVHRLL